MSGKQLKEFIETRLNKVKKVPQLSLFVCIFFGITIILFITRAIYFRGFAMLDGFKPNPFYMLSRAAGNLKKPRLRTLPIVRLSFRFSLVK